MYKTHSSGLSVLSSFPLSQGGIVLSVVLPSGSERGKHISEFVSPLHNTNPLFSSSSSVSPFQLLFQSVDFTSMGTGAKSNLQPFHAPLFVQ